MIKVIRRPSSLMSATQQELMGILWGPLSQKRLVRNGRRSLARCTWRSSRGLPVQPLLRPRRTFGAGRRVPVSVTVASQRRHRPPCHGMNVSPSGRFPSVLEMPWGSLMVVTPASVRLRLMISFKYACLANLPGPRPQDKPCDRLP